MRLSTVARLLAIGVTAALLATPAGAQTKNVTLSGFEEVPVVLTDATGEFRARIANDESSIQYELSYEGFENVTQAHIHIGGRAQSGGISVFLCTNLGNGPAGTQACPATGGTIQGTITPADIGAGAAAQGIAAGEFDEFVQAIRAGATYVNVHTVNRPGGEIRAQLDSDDD
jgi:hypothetical protein